MIKNCILLFNCAIIPVIVSAIMLFLGKKIKIDKINYITKQIIIGVIFGIIAIFSSEFGVNIGGATMNVRDSSPIISALIFGAPSGIIAGFIGGIWRWFAVIWGAGYYTRFACTLSTIIAGIFAAWLKKNIFTKKIPLWYYGLAIGIVAEVFHMLMIFITNMSDIHTAFTFVESCSIPMISVNAFAIMMAMIFANLINREKEKRAINKHLISNIFQINLFILVLFAFLLTSSFTFLLQYKITENDSKSLMKLNIEDIKSDILKMSDNNILKKAEEVKKAYESTNSKTVNTLKRIASENEIAEIDIIDENGIILLCTDESFIGFDMASTDQSDDFLILLDGKTTTYVQEYGKIGINSSISRKYAGITLDNGGFLQVGYDAEEFQKDIDKNFVGITENRHIGESGYVIVANKNGDIVSSHVDKSNIDIKDIGFDYTDEKNHGKKFTCNLLNTKNFCICDESEGYYIIAVLPISEAIFSRNIATYVNTFMEILVFAGLFILVYFLIKKLIVDNVTSVNASLEKITSGNLDEKVSVYSNYEFSTLSNGINATVDALKEHIKEEAKRLEAELKLAKSIQHSALPSVFPPYPNKKEFDIWATMNTAKEVGGDFYDIYMIDDNKIAFMIADVSGKGIPAAMFMMKSKTILKSYAEAGHSIEMIFEEANQDLCTNNEAEMFVTAWMGIVDLDTGKLSFINAGHNPPLLRHNGYEYEFIKERSGVFLASFENAMYKKHEIQLKPGDEVFLYTDGVTESINTSHEMYGEERLRSMLNNMENVGPEYVCKLINNDVFAFAGDEPQFDDITVLYFKYNGKI